MEFISTTKQIYEWCGLTSSLLQIYLKLFRTPRDDTWEAQKILLLKVLDKGEIPMEMGQTDLECSSSTFNERVTNIISLRSLTKNYLNECTWQFRKIRIFAYICALIGIAGGPIGQIIATSIAVGMFEGVYIPDRKTKIANVKNVHDYLKSEAVYVYNEFDKAKEKIREDVEDIGKLKAQTEETKILISLDNLEVLQDNILKSVNALIAQCNEYRKRHGKEVDKC